MWSHFFIERHAYETHQRHLHEAARDRLPREPRAGCQTCGRTTWARLALVLAAIATAMTLAGASGLIRPW
jgi:hypothetical protein